MIFPLPLYYRLQSAGHAVEHIIVLGQRGIKDSELRKRVATEDLVLLTQDTEFEDIPVDVRGKIIISRVRQSLPIQQRVDLWFRALDEFLLSPPREKVFELLENGDILPWGDT